MARNTWGTLAAAAGIGVAALAGASGCGVAVATESDILASRTAIGGLCPDGPCNEELVVHDDGVWVWVDNSTGRSRAGLLSRQDLEEVVDAVAETRVDEGSPFDGICPIAYDGMEVTYGFGEGSVSNCDLEVSTDDPLVAVLDALADEARRNG